MGRVPTQNKTPMPITSVTVEDVKRFLKNPSDPTLGPRENRFILDFNPRSGSASIWNKKATEIFTHSFIQKHNQYTNAREVSNAFKTHIFQLKNQYIDYRKFVAKSERLGDQMDILLSREGDVHNARMSRRRRVRICLLWWYIKGLTLICDFRFFGAGSRVAKHILITQTSRRSKNSGTPCLLRLWVGMRQTIDVGLHVTR